MVLFWGIGFSINSCVYFLQDGITGRFQVKGINSINLGKKKRYMKILVQYYIIIYLPIHTHII